MHGTQVGGNGRLCLPTVSSVTCSSGKDKRRKKSKSNVNSPVPAKGSMVFGTLRTVSGRTIHHSTSKRPVKSTDVRNLASKSFNARPSRLEAIIEILKPQGFSAQDAKAVATSLREGSNKVYEGKWARFTKWCEERQINPIAASLPEITSFLRFLIMEVALSYSAF